MKFPPLTPLYRYWPHRYITHDVRRRNDLFLKIAPVNLSDDDSKILEFFALSLKRRPSHDGDRVASYFRRVRFARVRTEHPCCVASATERVYARGPPEQPSGIDSSITKLALVHVKFCDFGHREDFVAWAVRTIRGQAGPWTVPIPLGFDASHTRAAQHFQNKTQDVVVSVSGSSGVQFVRTHPTTVCSTPGAKGSSFARRRDKETTPQPWRLQPYNPM